MTPTEVFDSLIQGLSTNLTMEHTSDGDSRLSQARRGLLDNFCPTLSARRVCRHIDHPKLPVTIKELCIAIEVEAMCQWMGDFPETENVAARDDVSAYCELPELVRSD